MGKNKLKRFAENETFSNLIQTEFTEYFGHDHPMKGQWRTRFFRNSNPIVLELGCGKGEYTIGLARLFPGKNFIGIDIKGARLWRGAKTALEQQMPNVAFVRTRIEIINSFFAENEVDEVWLTFPDPQPRQAKALKRLSSSRFLSKYRSFLRPGGVVHLKTDSLGLHRYTRALAELNGLTIHACTENLYGTMATDPILSIKTFYEQQFLAKGMPITYISFELNHEKPLEEPHGQP